VVALASAGLIVAVCDMVVSFQYGWRLAAAFALINWERR
jgi:hypothetical protein